MSKLTMADVWALYSAEQEARAAYHAALNRYREGAPGVSDVDVRLARNDFRKAYDAYCGAVGAPGIW